MKASTLLLLVSFRVASLQAQPTFQEGPSDQVADVGGTVTFTVTASSDNPGETPAWFDPFGEGVGEVAPR